MPFVPDAPSSAPAGRFVPDEEIGKRVKAAAREQRAPENKALPEWIDKHPGVGMSEAAMNLASGTLAKPISDVAGLAATGKEALFGGGGDPAAFKDYVQRAMTYQPRTSMGGGMARYNPLALLGMIFGKGTHAIGRAAGGGDEGGPLRSAFGHGVEETLNQLPSLAGVGGAKPAAAALRAGAEDMMQSAMKPSAKAREQILPASRTPQNPQGKTKAVAGADTMLDEGINVSRGGVEKLKSMIDDKNSAISKLIDNSPAVIDKKAVAAYLHDTITKFEKQVTPLEDVAAIQKAWDEFLAVQPDKIPVKRAQELKQGTTRALGDKSYGELKGASVEAQKTLARGLKEEIAKAVPQVRKLNAEESKLLNALSITEKRIALAANRNPVGLGWLTTDPKKFGLWMADRSEAFKSIIARMLNTGSRAAPVAMPPLGMAMTAQMNQLPPLPQQPGASPGP